MAQDVRSIAHEIARDLFTNSKGKLADHLMLHSGEGYIGNLTYEIVVERIECRLMPGRKQKRRKKGDDDD